MDNSYELPVTASDWRRLHVPYGANFPSPFQWTVSLVSLGHSAVRVLMSSASAVPYSGGSGVAVFHVQNDEQLKLQFCHYAIRHIYLFPLALNGVLFSMVLFCIQLHNNTKQEVYIIFIVYGWFSSMMKFWLWNERGPAGNAIQVDLHSIWFFSHFNEKRFHVDSTMNFQIYCEQCCSWMRWMLRYDQLKCM